MSRLTLPAPTGSGADDGAKAQSMGCSENPKKEPSDAELIIADAHLQRLKGRVPS